MLRSILILAFLATATPVQAGRLFGRRAACKSCQSSAAVQKAAATQKAPATQKAATQKAATQKAATQKAAATQKSTKPQRIWLFRRGR